MLQDTESYGWQVHVSAALDFNRVLWLLWTKDSSEVNEWAISRWFNQWGWRFLSCKKKEDTAFFQKKSHITSHVGMAGIAGMWCHHMCWAVPHQQHCVQLLKWNSNQQSGNDGRDTWILLMQVVCLCLFDMLWDHQGQILLDIDQFMSRKSN